MEEIKSEINEEQLRVQQAEKIIDFLNRIGAYEYVQNLVSHPELRKQFTFEEFKNFLIRINGMARDISTSQRRGDGETVYLEGFDTALMPRHEDKEGILQEAYDSIEKVSPGDESYLLPAVVNAVHLFADGNGRTSRVLHTLLYSKSEEEFTKHLRQAVGKNGRYDTPDISPGLIDVDIEKIILSRHGIQFEDNGKYSPIFPEGFGNLFATTEKPTTQKAKEFMALCYHDQPYCFIATYEYLKEKKLIEKVIIKNSNGYMLSPLKMEQELSEEDWKAVIDAYYRIKKEHVEVIIDVFVEPNKYKNIEGDMNLKDYFLKKIQERLESNKSR